MQQIPENSSWLSRMQREVWRISGILIIFFSISTNGSFSITIPFIRRFQESKTPTQTNNKPFPEHIFVKKPRGLYWCETLCPVWSMRLYVQLVQRHGETLSKWSKLMNSLKRQSQSPNVKSWNCWIESHHKIIHGPPIPRFLEFFMVNNLVFRWPNPLFFMVLGALGCLTLWLKQSSWRSTISDCWTTDHLCFPFAFFKISSARLIWSAPGENVYLRNAWMQRLG